MKSDNSKNPYTLITGASEGIGKALAFECAKGGRNLLLIALPGSGLEQVAEEISTAYRVDVKTFPVDLTESEAPKRIFCWVKDNSFSVNILINNAGIGYRGKFKEVDTAFLQRLIRLNNEVMVVLTHLFLPLLKQNQKSYILNLGSLAALFPIPYKTVYSASKSFVLTFSRALREELIKDNVFISCICPGPVLTNNGVNGRIEEIGWKAKFFAVSPEYIAEVAMSDLLKEKSIIIPSAKIKTAVKLAWFVPRTLIPSLAGKIFNKNGIK